MKQYFKIALLGFMASLNLHGSPLPENTPVASNPSAEKTIELIKADNVEELSKLIKVDHKDQIRWYRHPIAQENITNVDFEPLIKYDRSSTSPLTTQHIILGPNYSVLELVAKYGTPKTMEKLLNSSKSLDIFYAPYHSYEEKYGDGAVKDIAEILESGQYGAYPLATAAAQGNLDMVKVITSAHTMDISNALNDPAFNFIRPGIFVVGGNALIFALLNKHFDVAQHLLELGASPIGSLDSKNAFVLDMQDQRNLWRMDHNQSLKPIDILQLIRDAKLVVSQKITELIKESDQQKLENRHKEGLRVLKEEQDLIKEKLERSKDERNYDLYTTIKNHNINGVKYLISKYPTLLNESSVKETVIGSDLRIAQFIYNEMLKQKVPVEERMLVNWLYGAVISDSVDVFQWIVETLKFDIKNPRIEGLRITLVNIRPKSRIEEYLKKAGLLDLIKQNESGNSTKKMELAQNLK